MAVYTTIDNPELYFQVKLYTGTGSSQAFTLDGDEDMQPDFVWIKNRGATGNHMIFDEVRDTGDLLYSNLTSAELAAGSNGHLESFDSDGFTLGDNSGVGSSNGSSETYVAWCWKESATAGFDMVSYTGNGSTRTISHSLSAVPELMILKDRDATKSWVVYHHKNTSAPETEYLLLEGTGATTDSAVYFNDTAPTSSVFTVSTGTDANADGDEFISYHWTAKQGFSKFGSYLGNGSADGMFIYLGFRPAFILVKRTNSSDHWYIYDDQRGYNGDISSLRPNENHAESTASGYEIDILSTGFKARQNHDDINGDTDSYIYAAFAKAPFVNSKGVPCNAR